PGLSLWMEAYTTADFARTHSSRLPPWFLLLGLMFAATLSMTLLLLRRTRQHLAELHLEQQRLVAEVGTRKKAEKALENERSALERSNQSLNEFAYVASHDLREPLRGIQTSIHMLLESHGDAIPSVAKDRLGKVEELAQRTTQIINDLLLYSRLDNTRETYQEANLEGVLQRALKRMEPELSTREAQLQRQGAELPTADCAPQQISEVLARVLTNAMQYGPSDGPQILVCNVSTKDQIMIAIEDNGIGIAADKREKVFRIFTRLHHRDQYGGGTGAGLAIVRRILELHQGRVWIEDAQHFAQGTRVLISWPRHRTAEAPQA
ncbi:MAG: sensor histidine kinase, partial [Oceanococcaceae bacterium]